MPPKVKCTECNQTRVHYARGRCERCYKNWLRRRAYHADPARKARRQEQMRKRARERRKSKKVT